MNLKKKRKLIYNSFLEISCKTTSKSLPTIARTNFVFNPKAILVALANSFGFNLEFSLIVQITNSECVSLDFVPLGYTLKSKPNFKAVFITLPESLKVL